MQLYLKRCAQQVKVLQLKNSRKYVSFIRFLTMKEVHCINSENTLLVYRNTIISMKITFFPYKVVNYKETKVTFLTPTFCFRFLFKHKPILKVQYLPRQDLPIYLFSFYFLNRIL